MPQPIPTAPLTVLVLGPWQGVSLGSKNEQIERLLKDVLYIIRQADGVDIRLVYNQEVAGPLLAKRAWFEQYLESYADWIASDRDDETVAGMKKRLMEKVNFVDMEDIMREEWVGAFKGEHWSEWF